MDKKDIAYSIYEKTLLNFKDKYHILNIPPNTVLLENEQNVKEAYYLVERQSKAIYPEYNIYIDNYIILSKSAEDMLSVIRQLNCSGCKIVSKTSPREVLSIEEHKDESFEEVMKNIKSKPIEFEGFCANLFRKQGYLAEITPASNDGGYDIVLTDTEGQVGVVECKCFSTNNIVGRPLIQKLVGAGKAIGAKYMFFVTTSGYTQAAKDYAEEMNVKLINKNILKKWYNT